MLALADILIFVTAPTVKFVKTVSVLREMGRYPVEDNAYSLTVTLVHKIHKVLRLAEA